MDSCTTFGESNLALLDRRKIKSQGFHQSCWCLLVTSVWVAGVGDAEQQCGVGGGGAEDQRHERQPSCLWETDLQDTDHRGGWP